MAKKSSTIPGIGQAIGQAVKDNANLGKDQIREWLTKDIKGVYVLLAEVINSPECIDALTDIFWNRYVKMHEEKKAAEPELDLKS